MSYRTLGENSKRAKLVSSTAILTLILLLLITVPATFTSTTVLAESDCTPIVLSKLGFTNVALSDAETFPAGIFQFTFLAEFAEYYNINTLSYYPIETTCYHTVFSGPEGSTEPSGGYVIPPLSKTIMIGSEFGLSLLAPYRYFTEHELNPDFPEQHAKIYVNLDSPSMFLICFEDVYGGGDRDFNDMVISLQQIFIPEIVSVTRSPEAPTDNQTVTITAQVNKGTNDLGSVILSYQLNSSTWNNVTMSLESNEYVADIPAQQSNTQVDYKVYASDIKGYYDVSPLDSYTVRLSNCSPVAVLNHSPTEVYTGEAVEFDASESYDPYGEVVSYLWDFGDGSNSSEATVSHSYEEDGEYMVSLRVVDTEGLMDNKVATQLVKNRAPVADFTESASTTIINEEVSFDASPSYDLDGTIASYTWGFDDGTMATGITVNHSFANNGLHAVTLTVNDNDDATDTCVHTINVTEVVVVVNSPPIASFTVSAETVKIGETVSFDASESYDIDGTIVSYTWNFGDGNTATGVEVDHVYEDDGIYTVTLTVKDDDAATDSATRSLTVTETILNQSPVAIFNKSAETVKIGETVSFDASESYDIDGTITTYAWDFGDGNTATGVTTEHVYSAAGTYTITLTVTDNNEASSSVVDEVTVEKEAETIISLDVISWIVLFLTALTAALLYLLFTRKRNKNKKASS